MHNAAPHRLTTSPTTIPDSGQYLTFMVGAELFAIGIAAIKEITEYRQPTRFPVMPAHFSGVINLRDAVVPVIDLQARFGRSISPVTKRSCIVILEVGTSPERRVIGILVDSVSEVLDVPGTNIEPPPSFGAQVRTEFVRGVAKIRGEFVILLELENVLATDEAPAPSGCAEFA